MEDVLYLVAEEGRHRLGGVTVNAHRSFVDGPVAGAEVRMCLGSSSPGGSPSVFASVDSENHPGARITRIDGIGTDGFRLRIDTEAARTRDELTDETVAWIAIEQAVGILPSGPRVMSEVVPEAVNSEPFDWSVDLPDFVAGDRFYPWIADIVGCHGKDPVILHCREAVGGELRGM